MEEVLPKADLALFHQHQILQLLARGGHKWGNIAGPVSAQMQDGKYPNDLFSSKWKRNSSGLQSSSEKEKKKKRQTHKQLCVSFWSSAISSKT